MSFITRVQKAEEGASPRQAFRDVELERDHPALAEYLTAEVFPDGTDRQTATLLVFCEGGEFKGCVHDRENGRVLWQGGASLYDVLEALDTVLASGQGAWRAKKAVPPPKAKRGS